MLESEGHYICEECGEDIVIPVDATQGQSQQYVEDCPVCCHPNLISIEFYPDGGVSCRAELE